MAPTLARLFATVVSLLLTVDGARGDMGYQRNINPLLRFENLDNYPNYEFYLKYGHSRGNPHAGGYVTRVTNAQQVRLEGNGERFTQVFLVAVPRGESTPTITDNRDDDWLNKNPNGVLQSQPLNWDESYVMPFRVEISGDNLQIIPLPAELAPAEWAFSHIFTIILGLCLTVVIIAGGLFIARKRFKVGVAEESP